MTTYDIVIRNGLIVDGSGGEPYSGNVAIQGDNIAAVGQVTGNGRATIDDDDDDFWFGFEQEYFLWNPTTNLPPGFPPGGYPPPQGPYYCSVGARNAYCRDLIEEHLDMCLAAGLNVEGINAEVAAGQWEFQIFAKSAARAGDEIWLARYLLERTAEKYDLAGAQRHHQPSRPAQRGTRCLDRDSMTLFETMISI